MRLADLLCPQHAQLIFVCLWSAELSLSFDNYFTSTLVCTTSDSPYTANGPEATSSNVEPDAQMLDMPNMKPEICSLQIALIGLSFTSLIAYVVVLSVRIGLASSFTFWTNSRH